MQAVRISTIRHRRTTVGGLKEVATSEELASPGRAASSGRRSAIREKGKDAAPPADPAEGVYVHSIVESADPREFGKIGIGGRRRHDRR